MPNEARDKSLNISVLTIYHFLTNILFTIFRLILTTVLVTSKMYNDIYYTNQYIASVGGVTHHNICELERFYMSMIDWSLFISREEFDFYEQGLLAFQ